MLAPITVGLGIELDHVFGSRWLIDQLYYLGFCISYDETSLFKQLVMQDNREGILQSVHCEYSADNADCNLDTVTGAGTFHGVGVIRCSRRTTDARESENRIRRLAGVSVSHLADQKGIRKETYVPHEQLSTIRLRPIRELSVPNIDPPAAYYSNLLWRSTWMLRRILRPTPGWTNWSGYMQDVFRSADQSQLDAIAILPLIDMKSTDYNCLYSVICFVDNEVRSKMLPGTTLTFDQPLFVKAVEIVTAKQIKTVVIRLGGFHSLMSAVGSDERIRG